MKIKLVKFVSFDAIVISGFILSTIAFIIGVYSVVFHWLEFDVFIIPCWLWISGFSFIIILCIKQQCELVRQARISNKFSRNIHNELDRRSDIMKKTIKETHILIANLVMCYQHKRCAPLLLCIDKMNDMLTKSMQRVVFDNYGYAILSLIDAAFMSYHKYGDIEAALLEFREEVVCWYETFPGDDYICRSILSLIDFHLDDSS